MYYKDLYDTLTKLNGKEVSMYKIAQVLSQKLGKTVNASKIQYRRDNNVEFTDEEVSALSEYFKLAGQLDGNNTNFVSNICNNINNTTSGMANCCHLNYIYASCGNGITIDTSVIPDYDSNLKYSVIIAKGNSMSPTIENNDICIIKQYSGEIIDGIYLFSIGDDIFIKRLSNNINQLVCLSDNAAFDKIILQGDELAKVNIVGQVVGIIRKF